MTAALGGEMTPLKAAVGVVAALLDDDPDATAVLDAPGAPDARDVVAAMAAVMIQLFEHDGFADFEMRGAGERCGPDCGTPPERDAMPATRGAVALMTAVAYGDRESVGSVLDATDARLVAARVARWLVAEVVHNRGEGALRADLDMLGRFFARDDLCPRCGVVDETSNPEREA